MSPELFDPERFGLKESRPTKRSDCYALGMVIYEVLSGKAPFSQYPHCNVVVRVLDDERPERPHGRGGKWFRDDIWRILECCWRPIPCDRPRIRDVLECLETVSGSWTPPRMLAGSPTMDHPTYNPGSSDGESTDGGGPSSSSQTGSSQPSQEHPLTGDPYENNISTPVHGLSGPFHDIPNYQDLREGAKDTSGSDSEEPSGILDRVSHVGLLYSF